MSCRLTAQVVAALDADRLDPDGMLARHAAGCDDCARALAAAQLGALGHDGAPPADEDDAVLAALGLGPMPSMLDPLDRDFLRALAETADGVQPAPPPDLAGDASLDHRPDAPVPGGPAPIADRPSALSRPMAMIPPEEMLDLPPAPTAAVRAPRPPALRSGRRRYWPALLAGGSALAAALLFLVVLPIGEPGDLTATAPAQSEKAAMVRSPASPDDPHAAQRAALAEAQRAEEAEKDDAAEGDDEARGADAGLGAAADAAADDSEGGDKVAAASPRARRSRPKPAAATPKPSARPASPKPAAAKPAARKKEESTSEVDDLLGALDGSGGGSKGGGSRAAPVEAAAPAGDPMLPDKLTKRQILTVIKRNARSITTCKDGTDASGTVRVEMVIDRSGRVTAATVESGPQKGTPVGSCIERKVRAFRFPGFSGDPMRIVMPFAL